MPNRKGKRLNALKHGAFAQTTIVPGEDPQEFYELHSALIDEWKPVGPTEEDAVFTIAKGIWRKRRVQKFLEAKVTLAAHNPKHKAYDEALVLRSFCDVAEAAPDIALNTCVHILPADLQKKFPRARFKSTLEWAQAVKNEITLVILPEIERREGDDGMLRSLAVFSEDDAFKQELALDERLDMMIDRAIKRLIQTKAMKQMLGHPSPNGGGDQLKSIQSSKPDGSTKSVNSTDRSGR